MDYRTINKNFLEKRYINERKSANQIAKEIKCGETTIFRALEFNKIKRRTSKENQNPLFGKEPSKEKLIELHYNKHFSINKIAEKYNTSWGNIKRFFYKYKIRTKSHDEMIRPKNFIMPSKEEYEKMLWKDNLTTTEIAKRLKITSATVRHHLTNYKIPLKKTIKDRKPNGYWTMDKIVSEIKRLNNSNKNLSAKYSSLNYGKLFKGALKEFGSWGNAVNSVGINYKKIKEKYYKYLCLDGNRVLSIPEMQVANWLYKNSILYEYEPKIVENRKFKGDFKIGRFYLEILGGLAYKGAKGKNYKDKYEDKRQSYCKKNGAGFIFCLLDETEKYKPYFKDAPAILIEIIPKNNQIKERDLDKYLKFLMPKII